MTLSPAEFRQFRDMYFRSQAECGRALGLGARTVSRYEAGHTPVPETVALAMSAVVAGLQPWRPTPAEEAA